MTQWGPEIELREPGVRPKWLAYGDRVQWMCDIGTGRQSWRSTSAGDLAGALFWGSGGLTFARITHIILPADHWAYAPLGEGMEPWAGAQEAAPDDWTPGDPVMWRNGEVHSGEAWNWRKGQKRPSAGGRSSDIIGYKRRSEPVSAGQGEVAQLYWQPWVGCGVLATRTESGEKSDTTPAVEVAYYGVTSREQAERQRQWWQNFEASMNRTTSTESAPQPDTTPAVELRRLPPFIDHLSDRDLIKALRDDELLTQRLLHRAADRFEQALNAIDALRREFP